MERQTKLLEKDYIDAKLKEIKEIKKKEVSYNIYESNVLFSKTLYVSFFFYNGKTYWKGKTLRISDHYLQNSPHTQFIIAPDEYLTRKTKEKLKKTLNNLVRKTKKIYIFKSLKKITQTIDI